MKTKKFAMTVGDLIVLMVAGEVLKKTIVPAKIGKLTKKHRENRKELTQAIRRAKAVIHNGGF